MKRFVDRWLGRFTGGSDIVFALHLIQDLDLALPVMRALREAGVRVSAWCSSVLLDKSARVSAKLGAEGFPVKVLTMEQARGVRFPAGTRALLTAVETNLGPHRFSRLLSEKARAAGLFVATMQHGFDNVGLTYGDEVHPFDKIDFAAQRIYIWGPMDTLHQQIQAGVRGRCLPVGCPKPSHPTPAELGALIDPGRQVVGIFENLHWHRYDDAYRHGFLQGVRQLATAYPQVCFLLKPHHAGMWLSRQTDGSAGLPPNVVLADPQSPSWELHTAGALLHRLVAVITTPSTVALDAARQGLPVALFAGREALVSYEPLTMIRHPDDWLAFVQRSLSGSQRPDLVRLSDSFVARVIVPGDAARVIVQDVLASIR